jgi:hypothetical protein
LPQIRDWEGARKSTRYEGPTGIMYLICVCYESL